MASNHDTTIASNSHQSHLFEFQQIHHHLHHQQQQQQQQHHEQHHQLRDDQQDLISFEMMPSSSSSTPLAPSRPQNYIVTKETSGAYDLGELDQALFLYDFDGQAAAVPTSAADAGLASSSLSAHDQLLDRLDQSQNLSMRPPMLNIFPSQPMHIDSLIKVSLSTGGGGRSRRQPEETMMASSSMELSTNSISEEGVTTNPPAEPSKAVKREGNRKVQTISSEQGPKAPDTKTLRRLAQNREAARKSRLRKKAYVQQLESSRIKLTQLEHELQSARTQGIFFGGNPWGGDQGHSVCVANGSSEAAVFDLEYARWLEEHHRLTCELRAAMQEHIAEAELKLYVDNCLAHYDVVINLKEMVAKSDVFHIYSGMWKTPAERCFMWMGGFRPSELIKIIAHHVEPLTEQQLLGIYKLQQSMQEAEEALSQGLEALNQSLSDTIASNSLSCPPNMTNYMGQMALAMNKLSTLEGFVRQADRLRHQTLHRLNQVLTTRQAARCFIAIAEYFHRLRALSTLWTARPRQDHSIAG